MKKITTLLLFVFSSTLFAQSPQSERFVAGFDGGLVILPNSEFRSNRYNDMRLPLGVTANLHYKFNQVFGLRGSVLAGFSHGGNSENHFYEARYGVGSLSAVFSLFDLFDVDKKSYLEFDLGLGAMLFSSVLYDRANNDRVLRRVPHEVGRLSAVASLNAGLRYRIPLNQSLHLNFALNTIVTPTESRLDAARPQDERLGWIIMPSAGLSYSFITPSKSQKIIDARDLAAMERAISDTEAKLAQAQDEALSMRKENEYNQSSYREKVDALQSELDSLQKLAKQPRDVAPAPTPSVDKGTAQWRLIVGSYPTAEGARKFISQTALPKANMEIRYSEEHKVHRVIYASYTSLSEARSARDELKALIPDAWIIMW